MKQYGDHIRDTGLPKTSLKKKLELEMAMKKRECSFARYDAHLPIEGMLINEKNFPISPQHLKKKKQN